jgi:hypothetical protein
VPHTTVSGDEIALIRQGEQTALELTEQAFTQPVTGVHAPWLFRCAGAVMLWLGLLRLEWLRRWLQAVPGVGPMFRVPRLRLVSTVTVALLLVVAGWNWFAVQWLPGLGLLLAAVGLLWWLRRSGRRA